MKSFEKELFISVPYMLEQILGCKWSVALLQLCARGYKRPRDFLKQCTSLSAKVMYERLNKMMRFGILERRVFGEKPPIRVEYHLTPLGLRFIKIIEEIQKLQEELQKGEI